MRFKTFREYVDMAGDSGLVKGQTNIQVVTEDGEEPVDTVLVSEDGVLLIVCKGADFIATPKAKKKAKAKAPADA